MKKCFVYTLLTFLLATITQVYAIGVAYRIHNDQGERVGTCKRGEANNVYYLYDMHGRIVENPAKFMNQDPSECYLFDVDGLAIGKCTSTRVIMWGRAVQP